MIRGVEVVLSDGRSYSIHIGSGLRHRIGEFAPFAPAHGRAVVVGDENVFGVVAPWGPDVVSGLSASDWIADGRGFAMGEARKEWRTVEASLEYLYRLGDVDRSGILVACGGGVAGDVVGFAASLWMRGVRCVQFPTTLLAAVDSSVGGKTGIDLLEGKNLVGTFHQPAAVVVDTDCFASLPEPELRSGAAEVVKYGFISDPTILDVLVDEAGKPFWENSTQTVDLIERSCRIKAAVVGSDEREEIGRRAILNYGHTMGHALEGATRYRRFRHGEAISIGMVTAACIGEVVGCTPPEIRCRTVDALRSLGLPWQLPRDIGDDVLIEATRRDKKASRGQVRYVLATEMGVVELVSVEEDKVREGLARHRSMRGDP